MLTPLDGSLEAKVSLIESYHIFTKGKWNNTYGVQLQKHKWAKADNMFYYKGDSIYTVAEKLDYLLLLQVMICPSGASQLTYCTDVQVL